MRNINLVPECICQKFVNIFNKFISKYENAVLMKMAEVMALFKNENDMNLIIVVQLVRKTYSLLFLWSYYILYFFSSTLVLTSSIDVVFILSMKLIV